MPSKKTGQKNGSFLLYKGKPLARCGNTLYYGYPSDEYVACIQIIENAEESGMEVAKKTVIQLLSTNQELSIKDRIIKKADKPGLYEALDIASIWLERSNL